MRKKKVKRLAKSKSPMNAIYDSFSPQLRAEFKRFAGAFGYTEEMIKNELRDERSGKHIN